MSFRQTSLSQGKQEHCTEAITALHQLKHCPSKAFRSLGKLWWVFLIILVVVLVLFFGFFMFNQPGIPVDLIATTTCITISAL